jgi:hypothetical protein
MFAIMAAVVMADMVSTPSEAAGLRIFNRWIVACDNTRYCRAVGLNAGENRRDAAFLAIERAGGPAGGIALWWGPGGGAFSEVFVDGERIASFSEKAIADLSKDVFSDEPRQGLRDPELVTRIVRRALDGSTLSLEADAKPEARVSLDEMRAALRWMDEEQGRVGTVTALVARGRHAASAVPMATQPPLLPRRPSVAAALASDAKLLAAVLAFHKRHADRKTCDGIDGKEADDVSGEAVDGRTWLFRIHCWRAAYQGGFAYYVSPRSGKADVAKAQFEWIDEETGRLSLKSDRGPTEGGAENVGDIEHFHKGRGAGDCFEQATFRWDGRVFRLAAYRLQPVCGGPLGSEHAFTIWRTRDR